MNNIQLVEHCKKALNEKWGYVYGTFGQVLNETLLRQKLTQYPANVKQFESFIRKNWMNRRVADCVGLIKSYLWWNNGNVKYTPAQDKSANGMYNIAKEKGPLNTIPEIPGVLVWKNGHIGVYIGNGQVIESHGTKAGVVQTPLSGKGATGWTNWCKCIYINYEEVEASDTINVLVNGKKLKLKGYLKEGVSYIKVDNQDVPLRKVAELLGFNVGWDGKMVTING